MVKKLGVCLVFMLCVCCSIACADEEPVTPSPAATMEVVPSLFDDEEMEEAAADVDDEVDSEDADTIPLETATPAPSPDADSDSSSTPSPSPVSEVTAEPSAAAPVLVSVGAAEPSSVPEISEEQFRFELLDTVGKIEGILIFFCVVALCYFSYKFLRIFF